MTRWTQVELRPERSPDEGVLIDHVGPLLARLRPRLRTLHYFWSDEARLCLLQARYRVRLLSFAAFNEARRPALEALVSKLEAALEEIDEVTAAEQRLVDQWRERGRPSLAEMLSIPKDFHRAPSAAD